MTGTSAIQTRLKPFATLETKKEITDNTEKAFIISSR